MYKVLEMAQPVKNLPANAGDLGSNPWVGKIPRRRERLSTLVFWPGEWEDPLEKEGQFSPVFLPGECPWTEESHGLQSTGLERVGNN